MANLRAKKRSSKCPAHDRAQCRNGYQVTRSAALAGGEDMNAYARRTRISLNTAKYHLKAAFVATGASRQSELVRLASAVLQNFGTEAAAGLP